MITEFKLVQTEGDEYFGEIYVPAFDKVLEVNVYDAFHEEDERELTSSEVEEVEKAVSSFVQFSSKLLDNIHFLGMCYLLYGISCSSGYEDEEFELKKSQDCWNYIFPRRVIVEYDYFKKHNVITIEIEDPYDEHGCYMGIKGESYIYHLEGYSDPFYRDNEVDRSVDENAMDEYFQLVRERNIEYTFHPELQKHPELAI